MALFKKNPNEAAYRDGKKHWAEVIKNTGPGDPLIWKQPEEDFNTNSTLIVMPGEAAIFVNRGVVEQVFENGTYKTIVSDTEISLTLRTDYPLSGSIAISVETSAPIDTAIKIRIPAWSEKTTVKATVPYEIKDGCLVLKSLWQGGESVLLELDMSVRLTRPVKWDTELIYNGPATDPRWYAASAQTVVHDDKDDRYISLSYGPLTLAADAALGRNPKLPVDIVGEDGTLSYTVASPAPLSERETPMLRLEFASAKEGKISLIDYASAGRAWDRPVAAWLPVL